MFHGARALIDEQKDETPVDSRDLEGAGMARAPGQVLRRRAGQSRLFRGRQGRGTPDEAPVSGRAQHREGDGRSPTLSGWAI